MTTDPFAPARSAQEASPEDPSYRFIPSLIEQQGRSVGVVLGSRLCEAARAKLKSEPRTMSYAEIRRLFKANCANQDGYLSPQHPVLETVLRLLLISKADSMTLTDIHDQVSFLWLTSTWPRHINKDAMRRVLDRAASHGIIPA